MLALTVALALLLLAALAALSATHRSVSRLRGAPGWSLSVLLFGLAVAGLQTALGLAEAIAVGLGGLMVLIPLASVAQTIRRPKEAGRGR